MKHILGYGMQSGGTTIISSMWFRRPDTDGILDVHNKKFPCLWFTGKRLLPNTTVFHQKLTFNARRGFEPELIVRIVKAAFETADVKWYLIVRNPFDTISSLKLKKWGTHWKRKLRKYDRVYKHAKRHGIPIIRYEDFVMNPRGEMMLLFAALGVPLDTFDERASLAPKVFFRAHSDQPSFSASGGAVQRVARGCTLTESERATIRRVCRHVIEAENYKEPE